MYSGPPIDDPAILDWLPTPYRTLLLQVNGYVAYNGGLHIREACRGPDWHSLRNAWQGPDSLQALYPVLTDGDIPFAEDALGDQYLVREGDVIRLDAETATIHRLGVDVVGFDAAVRADPTGFLSLQPLDLFRANGGTLLPGQLLSVYPPYCTKATGERSIRAVPALDRRHFLASLASQLRNLPDGAVVQLRVDEPAG